jgi:hypothetical protein
MTYSGTWIPSSLTSQGITRQFGQRYGIDAEWGIGLNTPGTGGCVYIYIDGWFYQNEGMNRVLDTSNFSEENVWEGKQIFKNNIKVGEIDIVHDKKTNTLNFINEKGKLVNINTEINQKIDDLINQNNELKKEIEILKSDKEREKNMKLKREKENLKLKQRRNRRR